MLAALAAAAACSRPHALTVVARAAAAAAAGGARTRSRTPALTRPAWVALLSTDAVANPVRVVPPDVTTRDGGSGGGAPAPASANAAAGGAGLYRVEIVTGDVRGAGTTVSGVVLVQCAGRGGQRCVFGGGVQRENEMHMPHPLHPFSTHHTQAAASLRLIGDNGESEEYVLGEFFRVCGGERRWITPHHNQHVSIVSDHLPHLPSSQATTKTSLALNAAPSSATPCPCAGP